MKKIKQTHKIIIIIFLILLKNYEIPNWDYNRAFFFNTDQLILIYNCHSHMNKFIIFILA